MDIVTLLGFVIPMIGLGLLLYIVIFFTLVLLVAKVLDTIKQDKEDFRK